jgi:hypothetical protein
MLLGCETRPAAGEPLAARAGLAPMADDSGRRRGRGAIGGARAVPRSLLCIAALQAARRDPGFRAFRARMQAAGLTVKQAPVSTARKLLTVFNAMLRVGTDFVPAAATRPAAAPSDIPWHRPRRTPRCRESGRCQGWRSHRAERAAWP